VQDTAPLSVPYNISTYTVSFVDPKPAYRAV
jgi:hypothetical protein